MTGQQGPEVFAPETRAIKETPRQGPPPAILYLDAAVVRGPDYVTKIRTVTPGSAVFLSLLPDSSEPFPSRVGCAHDTVNGNAVSIHRETIYTDGESHDPEALVCTHESGLRIGHLTPVEIKNPTIIIQRIQESVLGDPPSSQNKIYIKASAIARKDDQLSPIGTAASAIKSPSSITIDLRGQRYISEETVGAIALCIRAMRGSSEKPILLLDDGGGILKSLTIKKLHQLLDIRTAPRAVETGANEEAA